MTDDINIRLQALKAELARRQQGLQQDTITETPQATTLDLPQEQQLPLTPNPSGDRLNMLKAELARRQGDLQDQVSPVVQDDVTMRGELGKGFMRGMGRIGATITDAIPSQVRKITGDEEGAQAEWESYQDKLKQLDEAFPKGIYTGESDLKKFGLFSANLLGEGLPSLGFSLGSGGLGLAVGGLKGMSAATLGSSYLLNTPESYANLMESGDVENPELWALGIGALKSGLDYMPINRLFRKTYGELGQTVLTNKLLSRAGMKEAAKIVGRQIPEQMALEGITEGGQEAIDIAAEQLLNSVPDEFFTKENMQRIAISGYGGALVGAVGGGLSGGVQLGGATKLGGEEMSPEEMLEKLKKITTLDPELEKELLQQEVENITAEETLEGVKPLGEVLEQGVEVRDVNDAKDVINILDKFNTFEELLESQGMGNDEAIKNAAKIAQGIPKAPPIDNLKDRLRSTGTYSRLSLTNNELESVTDVGDLEELTNTLYNDMELLELPDGTKAKVIEETDTFWHVHDPSTGFVGWVPKVEEIIEATPEEAAQAQAELEKAEETGNVEIVNDLGETVPISTDSTKGMEKLIELKQKAAQAEAAPEETTFKGEPISQELFDLNDRVNEMERRLVETQGGETLDTPTAGSRGLKGARTRAENKLQAKIQELYPDLTQDEQVELRTKLAEPTQRPRFSKPRKDAAGFYSRLEDHITKNLPNIATSKEYMKLLVEGIKPTTYKAEELYFSGLEEYLEEIAPDKKVAKESLIDHIRTFGLQTQTVAKNRHETYTLLGNNERNYFELLTRQETPRKHLSVRAPTAVQQDFNVQDTHKRFLSRAAHLFLDNNGVWVDPSDEIHFGEVPNVLMWSRGSDQIVDGEPTRFIQEIQSKLHQDGQKYGYVKEEEIPEYQEWLRKIINDPDIDKILKDGIDAATKISLLGTKAIKDYSKMDENLPVNWTDTPLKSAHGYEEYMYDMGELFGDLAIEQYIDGKEDWYIVSTDHKNYADKLYHDIIEPQQNERGRRYLPQDPVDQAWIKNRSFTINFRDHLEPFDFDKFNYYVTARSERIKMVKESLKVPDLAFKKTDVWTAVQLKKEIRRAAKTPSNDYGERYKYKSITIPLPKTAAEIQSHPDTKLTDYYYGKIVPKVLKKVRNELQTLYKQKTGKTIELPIKETFIKDTYDKEAYRREKTKIEGKPYFFHIDEDGEFLKSLAMSYYGNEFQKEFKDLYETKSVERSVQATALWELLDGLIYQDLLYTKLPTSERFVLNNRLRILKKLKNNTPEEIRTFISRHLNEQIRDYGEERVFDQIERLGYNLASDKGSPALIPKKWNTESKDGVEAFKSIANRLAEMAEHFEQYLIDVSKSGYSKFGDKYPTLTLELPREIFDFINDYGIPRLEKPQEAPRVQPPVGIPYEEFIKMGDRIVESNPQGSPLYEATKGQLDGIEIIPEDQSPQLRKQLEKIMKEAARIGGKKMEVVFVNDLKGLQEGELHPVHGAQLGATIYLSVNLDTQFPQLLKTFYHEAWHYLFDERMGLYTDEEREMIVQGLPEISKILQKQYGIGPQDIMTMYQMDGDQAGIQEVVANAFAEIATDQNLKNMLSGPVRQLFERAIRFIKNLGNLFRNNGITDFKDVFQKTLEGKAAADQTIYNVLTDITHARHQRISDALNMANKKDLEDESWKKLREKRIKQAERILDKPYTFKDKLFDNVRKYYATATHNGRKNPLFSYAYSVVQNWEKEKMNLMQRIAGKGTTYVREKDNRIKAKANEILEYLDRTGQELVINDDGHLEYYDVENGKLIRYKDPKFVDMVKGLQDIYKEPLRIVEERIRNNLARKAPEWAKLRPDTIRKKINDELKKPGISDTKKKKLNELKTEAILLKNIDQILKSGTYYPHQRFGPYGLTVHKKSDMKFDKKTKTWQPKPDATPVYFTRMEEGSYQNKYDKIQYLETQKDIAQYKNNSDYHVSEVFHINRPEIFNKLSSQMVSIELVLEMMGNAKNEKEYKELITNIGEKIQTKGFSSRWGKRKNIPGYSKDGVRVADTYVQNAVNYISRQKYAPLLETFRGNMAKLGETVRTKGLVDPVEDYIDYILDPENEWQRMVEFQYLWTMGANPSSAMIQFATPLLITSGYLTLFDGNIMKHYGRAMRNMKRLYSALMSSDAVDINPDGTIVLRWDKVKNNKFLSNEEVEMLKDFFKVPESGEQFFEDSLGVARTETRGLRSHAKGKWDKTKNMMGILMSASEQLSRGVSFLTAIETFQKNPRAARKIDQVLEGDMLWENERATGDNDIIFDAAKFVVQETHIDFGKRARARINRGAGRVIIPFAQYPMGINEMLLRLPEKGNNEGKRAIAMTLMNLFMFSGLIGLPAAELLKEVFEEIFAMWAEEGLDIEQEVRAIIKDATGSTKLGVAATQGIVSGFTNLDLGPRLRQQIAGQDIILALLGVRGGMEELGGVPASVWGNYIKGFQEMREGASAQRVMGQLSPSGLANLFKTAEYYSQGAYTGRGNRLLSPDDIKDNSGILFLRMLGFGSTQLARKREEQFWSNTLNQKYRPKMNTLKRRASNAFMKMMSAAEKDNPELEEKYRQEYLDVYQDLSKFLIDNSLPYDPASFNRAVFEKVQRNIVGSPLLKDYDKMVRPQAGRIKAITVGEED